MSKIEILQQKGHNFLWVDGNLCMWDIPTEQKAQMKIANKAFGNVLVAGYGLGIIQKFLFENKNVKSIVTIEKSKEIIDNVKQFYGKMYGDVIIQDFYDYQTNKKFDCVIGDVWEDMEEGNLKDYEKFKAKAQQLIKPNGKILAWGQGFFEYLLTKEK